jgi:hypothetical protein
MADNIVDITIRARDLSGPAYASAEAKEKAFQRVVDDGNKRLQRLGDQNAAIVERSARARQDAAFLIARAERFMSQEAEKAAKVEKDLNTALSFGSGVMANAVAPMLSLGMASGGLASTIGLILVPLAALVALMAGPLIAALLPITAGFAGFAVVAVRTYQKVTQSLQGLISATNNYSQASLQLNQAIHKSPADMQAYQQSLAGLEPDLRNAAKLLTDQNITWQGLSSTQRRSVDALSNNKAALKNLLPDQKAALAALMQEKAAWDDLTPAQQTIAKGTEGLGREFRKLEGAVQPQIMKLFGDALGIINHLMPTLIPLAKAAGNAIDGFLKNILTWIEGPSGKKFLTWMAVDGPKAIATFGRVMWDVAQGIGRTFAFLNNAGDTWWRNVKNGTATIAKAVVDVWHVFVNAWHAIVNSVHADVAAITAIWATVYNSLVAPVLRAYHAISGLVSSIGSALSRIPGMINSALGGIPGKVLNFIGLSSGGIVGAAVGGVHSGLRWVGEQGPELVRLPTGSMVYPAGQSAAMAAQAGGGAQTFNINVRVAPGTSPAETGRQIAYYLGEFKKRGGKIYSPAGFLCLDHVRRVSWWPHSQVRAQGPKACACPGRCDQVRPRMGNGSKVWPPSPQSASRRCSAAPGPTSPPMSGRGRSPAPARACRARCGSTRPVRRP